METIKVGSAGKDVTRVQQYLITLGYQLVLDQKFGPEDEKAVRDFQSSYFLPVTGMVDDYLFRVLRTLARDTEDGDFVPKVPTNAVATLPPVPLTPNLAVRELQKIGTTNRTTAPAVTQTATNVAAKGYTSLAAGKPDFDALVKANLPAAQKSQLIAALKKKVIWDVYGKAYKTDIDALPNLLRTQHPWLLPEGMEAHMQLTLDSENVFNDGFYRRNVYYNYAVERQPNSDTARLVIKAVKNNMSNLVYNSSLKYTVLPNNQIDVDIFLSRNVGYTWQESRADYLQSLFTADRDTITPTPVGSFSALRDPNHGYNPADVVKKVVARDFSVKNAIKTAVRYFILDYNKALKVV
ncbi:MAG: peptidoglycan-binding protein [Bernardetiaceae bacterium]|jgi:peptidoglycan hydrolase-like protein with peptidoglycan-binding domain|nr:peptidoglycan-binding protein [Bernardetiaceae bacterium]